jgi:hypothetical protein
LAGDADVVHDFPKGIARQRDGAGSDFNQQITGREENTQSRHGKKYGSAAE